MAVKNAVAKEWDLSPHVDGRYYSKNDTSAPPAPGNPSATAISDTEIEIDCDTSVDPGSTVVAYSIYMGTTDGGPYTFVISIQHSQFPYTVTGLEANERYYFKITATNAGLPPVETLLASCTQVDDITDGGGGPPPEDNPDDYDLATVLWMSRDYETQVSNQISEPTSPSHVVDMVYGASYGWNGAGGWRAYPWRLNRAVPPGNEQNAGWVRAMPTVGVDTAPLFMCSYMLFISTELMDAIFAQSEGFWAHSQKSHDHRQYNANGIGIDGTNPNTRWNCKCERRPGGVSVPDGVYMFMSAGGAGTQIHDQPSNPDMRTYAGEWVWHGLLCDGPNLTMRHYFKRSGDPVIRALQMVGQGLEYNGHGFALNERTLWGYWDDILGSVEGTDADQYLAVSRVRYGNGWIGPPDF